MSTFDPAALELRLGELNEQLSQPGFWDDPKAAEPISREHARTTRKLETYSAITSEIDDLPTLLEMVE